MRASSWACTKRTYTIGLMLHSPRELIYAEMLSGIQSRLLGHGYAGICAFWNNMAQARAAFRSVLERGVDGLISCHDDLTLLPKDIPTVLFQQRHPRRDSLVRDGDDSMRQAVNYLVDLGHRRLGTIYLDRKRFGDLVRDTLRDRGIESETFWTAGRHRDHTEAARDCLAQFLALPPDRRPTAVICRNDTTAMTVISMAGAQGVVVPRDLSVLGSDAVTLGALTNPPLTTLGVLPAELARRLVELMLRRLARPDAPCKELLLKQRLIERSSCAPPRNG
jgi:DNA-binding LacI/PurR family transcriptional regulator